MKNIKRIEFTESASNMLAYVHDNKALFTKGKRVTNSLKSVCGKWTDSPSVCGKDGGSGSACRRFGIMSTAVP